jgi:ribosomal protein S27AE
MRSKNSSREVLCSICGNPFFTRHSQGKYCSDSCRHEGIKNSYIKYGNKNKEKRRIFHKQWYLKNKERRTKQILKYQSSPKGKMSIKIAGINSRIKHPEKYIARMEVLKARRKGLINKEPCEVCGNKEVHAHHDDYSKPLKIRWLCKKHHLEIHNKKEEF